MAKEIVEKIKSLEVEELTNYIYQLDDKYNLLILNNLFSLFLKTNEIKYADLISVLSATKFCKLEGIELFEINLYELVLDKFPNSIPYLKGILTFGQPPYIDEVKTYFDYEMYRNKLASLKPEGEFLF